MVVLLKNVRVVVCRNVVVSESFELIGVEDELEELELLVVEEIIVVLVKCVLIF